MLTAEEPACFYIAMVFEFECSLECCCSLAVAMITNYVSNLFEFECSSSLTVAMVTNAVSDIFEFEYIFFCSLTFATITHDALIRFECI